MVEGHNLAWEPRGSLTFDVAVGELRSVDVGVADELTRRGAWARCNQIMGALAAACELTVAHTSERVQFGRQLNKFQAVQHSLAAMAGEIERARAATALAVAAAADYGFDHTATAYATTVAKVSVGRAVDPVSTIAHQLHGAIGVTAEHRLWRATMRARSWVDEFGTTTQHARRLGRIALAADDPWDVVVSYPAPR
jgi:acyl-CoA dehydrogenase